MNNTIDTATPKEIAEYLDHLHDIAWEKSNHKTDEYEGDENVGKVWRNLYDFVFSDNISHKLTKRFGILDYYDPDTSYYADVTAYINAFKEFAETYDENPTGMFPTFDEYQKYKNKQKETMGNM